MIHHRVHVEGENFSFHLKVYRWKKRRDCYSPFKFFYRRRRPGCRPPLGPAAWPQKDSLKVRPRRESLLVSSIFLQKKRGAGVSRRSRSPWPLWTCREAGQMRRYKSKEKSDLGLSSHLSFRDGGKKKSFHRRGEIRMGGGELPNFHLAHPPGESSRRFSIAGEKRHAV